MSQTGSLSCAPSSSMQTGTCATAVDAGRTTISVGWYHACAAAASRSVQCWGAGSAGTTGGNNQLQSVVPLSGGSNQIAVAAGGFHTCALSGPRGSAVWCWGRNVEGQVNVPASLVYPIAAITAGSYHTCALSAATGGIKCWGSAAFITVPTAAQSGQLYVVAAGSHTCSLSVFGSVTCWGQNVYQECAVPALVAASPQRAIAAGYRHSCAVSNSTGTVACWGQSTFGQTAVPFVALSRQVAVVCGYGHSCSLSDTGVTTCWGQNNYGQTNVPENLGVVTALASNGGTVCALSAPGSLRCWGQNDFAQASVPAGVTAAQPCSPKPLQRKLSPSPSATRTATRTKTKKSKVLLRA